MLLSAILPLTLASMAGARYLFVSSYAGSVTTLNLTDDRQLLPVSSSNACARSPSWLELGVRGQQLFCVDEGDTSTATGGSINSFAIADKGSLKPLNRTSQTLTGPVNSQIYWDDKQTQRAIAIANYAGSSMSIFKIGANGDFNLLSSFTFPKSEHGPNPTRQPAPRPHQVKLDPSNKFLVVPDLGSDLVRVFQIDPSTLNITQRTPLNVTAGSGPRHVAFQKANDKSSTYMYLVTELASTVTSYQVDYSDPTTMKFKQVQSNSTYGPQKAPAGIAAAEIAVFDNFLTVSNRNDSTYSLSNPDPKNSTNVTSDSLATFKLNGDGTFSFLQLTPSGGSYPRNFHINKEGTLVAVVEQMSSRVAILARDVKTGLIGNAVAWASVAGQVTSVVWAS